ncbi:MAG: carboxypeptidase regulatory-like domain-containing protein [Bacillota bacterium]
MLVAGLGTTLALFAHGTGPGLQGQVVDGMSGSPVTGAVVRVGARKAVTNAEGRFSLKGFDPGRATVRVSAPGYEPLQVTAPTSPVILGLLPAAVWSEDYPIPGGREHTVDTGRGLTVTVAAGAARKLKVREHTGGADAAVDIKQAFTLELTGVPGPGKRQATLTFELPPEVDPAQAVILRWTEEGWVLAVPGDEPGDVAALGGTLTAGGRAISVELDSLSTYALATFRQELRAFPISTRVVSQDFDANGNLVVEVLLEQPRQLLGFVGAWYEVEVRNRINLLSVSAPGDPLFGLPAWSEGSAGRGFIAPGETKRLVLVFPGTGGSAQIHYDLMAGLPMAAVDWVCRLATGSNLPWPLTVTGAVETFAEPLLDLVEFLRQAELAWQVQKAVQGVSWGATVLQGPRAILGRVQTQVVEYATTQGLEQLYEWFGDTLGRRDWIGRPLGKAQAWTEQAGALWLRLIRTTDMSVSTAVHAQMGYRYHTGTVSGSAGVKVVVEPAAAEVQAGQSVRFTARVTTLDGGREVTFPFLRWEVSGGGKVSQDGVFTAGQTGGTFRVTALTAGADLDGNPRRIEGAAQVRVGAPAPAAPTARPPATAPSEPKQRRPMAAAPGSDRRAVLAAGKYHSLALRADGTVWAWGSNGAGRLGDGTTTDRPAPVQVRDLADVVAVAAGTSHSLALRADGTVWAWGSNYFGQLGDGTTTDRHTPVQVRDLADVVAVAAGTYHSLALRADGTVWAWGWNSHGELGDGTTTERHTPVQVRGLADVVAVEAGSIHSLAVRADGTTWTWGGGADRHTPVQVRDLADVVAVAAQFHHSLALRADGTVWAWGENSHGELGDGTTTDRPTPVQVRDLADVVAVAAGEWHSLALRADGTVWAWGENSHGELGDGTTTDHPTPVQVRDLADVVAVATGGGPNLALRADGTVWTWGDNPWWARTAPPARVLIDGVR